MQLGTFSAIMSFAMQLESQAMGFYAEDSELSESLREELKRGAAKRHKRLEKARREGVVEIALVPISGLDGDEYSLGDVEGGALRVAIVLEETGARFYHEAGEKMPMQEIARLFNRCARSNEENAARLREALAGDG